MRIFVNLLISATLGYVAFYFSQAPMASYTVFSIVFVLIYFIHIKFTGTYDSKYYDK